MRHAERGLVDVRLSVSNAPLQISYIPVSQLGFFVCLEKSSHTVCPGRPKLDRLAIANVWVVQVDIAIVLVLEFAACYDDRSAGTD